MSYAWVARARGPSGPLVLKLSVPGTESRSEPQALARFPSAAACELYAAEPSVCAILIEELRPGETLWTVSDFTTRLRIAAGVFASLHASDPDASADLSPFPAYVDLARRSLAGARDELRHSGATAPSEPAEATADAGWRTALGRVAESALEHLGGGDEEALPQPVLIHGDLHHGNILSSGDSWRAIDPKGVAAPLWMEPARYIINQYDDASAPERPTQFGRMVRAFADALGVPGRLVARGAAIDAAVSAVWSWEDGEEGDTLAVAADRAGRIARFATRW